VYSLGIALLSNEKGKQTAIKRKKELYSEPDEKWKE
jgi:hypothetical protein